MTDNEAKAEGYSVIILAGSRPGGDLLAERLGAAGKALIKIGGDAMLSHVVRCLHERTDIENIHIVTELEDVIRSDDNTSWIGELHKVDFHKNVGTIAAALLSLFESGEVSYPAIITTADNPLITNEVIDQFLSGSRQSDIGIAMVERRVLEAKYPSNKRTWLKFRGGQYSGANLFLLGSPQAQKAINLWAKVEQDRKKGWRIFTLFGPWLLLLVLLRLIDLKSLGQSLSQKLGVKIMAVEMKQAEACIDVDKPSDVALANAIMENRQAPS